MQEHRKVLTIAAPLVFSLLIDVLIVYTDFFMVAKLGADAISAVGMSGQIWLLFRSFTALIYTGENAVLTRYIGAKDYKKASIAFSSIIIFALVFSIPLMILWNFIGVNVFYWFNSPLNVTLLGEVYIKTLVLVSPLMVFNSIFFTGMMAYGDTRTGMFINIAVVFLNAALDYILIFGHGGFDAMGVKGAAVATVISEIFSFAVFFILYLKGKMRYFPMFRFSKRILKRVLRVGFPAMIDKMLFHGSYLFFTGIILSLGTAVYAGFQIGFKIEGFAFMPGIAFAITASILMGQGLGEKDPDKSYRYVMITLKFAVLLMFIVSLAFMLIPEKLGSFFTDDKEILHIAALYLIIVGISQVPLGMEFVFSHALKGAGDTKRTFIISILSMWIVRIIPSLAAVYLFHSVIGVFLAMIADTFVKAFLYWRLFQKGDWRVLKI